jgi:hypothetical protein
MCCKSDVRFAPNSDRKSVFPHKVNVRFAPESGHLQCTRSCPLWAKSGLMRRSKKDRYSITSDCLLEHRSPITKRPIGTASSAGDQSQPRRCVEGAHQQIHHRHSAQRR